MKKPITSSRAEILAIGEVSNRTSVNIETIRYYERIGLLPPPNRQPNGRRVFDGEQVTRLTFIRRARDMGFSQDEVRTLLVLADGGSKSCEEVRDLATTHLQSIREKIAGLKKMERALADTVSKCVGKNAPACPVLEVLASDTIA